eukprot:COSAG06_NODE_19660_length_828_cov_0.866941_1_plen_233_part_01
MRSVDSRQIYCANSRGDLVSSGSNTTQPVGSLRTTTAPCANPQPPMQQRLAVPVVDPALGELYRKLENSRVTRDWLIVEGLETAVVDRTIDELQAKIRELDARDSPTPPPDDDRGQAWDEGRVAAAIEASLLPAATPVPAGSGPSSAETEDAQVRRALEMSLAVPAGTKERIAVPPEWHRFVDKDLMLTIKTAAGLTAIDSRMPSRPDLDGCIVLEGSPQAVREAKRLLEAPI